MLELLRYYEEKYNDDEEIELLLFSDGSGKIYSDYWFCREFDKINDYCEWNNIDELKECLKVLV